MADRIDLPLDALKLRQLFTKPYGVDAPDEQQWRDVYAADVQFEDPTQKRVASLPSSRPSRIWWTVVMMSF